MLAWSNSRSIPELVIPVPCDRVVNDYRWGGAHNAAVNKRDLSTGETREFAGGNVGFGLNPGG